MPIAYVQHAVFSGSSGTSFSNVAGLPGVSTGNAIMFCALTNVGSSITLDVLSDSRGNTYSRIARVVGNANISIDVWLSTNVTGGSGSTTFSGTFSGSIAPRLLPVEISGMKASSPLSDSASVYIASGTSLTTPDVSLSSSGAVFALGTTYNNRAWTAGGTYTELYDSASIYFLMGRVGLSAGSYAADATIASSSNAMLLALAFLDDSAPSATSYHSRPRSMKHLLIR